jgi:thiamine pyrophosphate-dependent acetolactate synthase large subunit-like protein
MARSGTPGPVFVELPVDVLYPESVVAKEVSGAGGKKKGKSLVDLYLQRSAKPSLVY